jgi:hypothetical protein
MPNGFFARQDTAPSLQATGCNFATLTNPQFTVTVQRSGLPTFFGRIWGIFPGTTTAPVAMGRSFGSLGAMTPLDRTR